MRIDLDYEKEGDDDVDGSYVVEVGRVLGQFSFTKASVEHLNKSFISPKKPKGVVFFFLGTKSSHKKKSFDA